MGLMLLVVGIFGGLFIFIATTYSLAQAILTEGRLRWVHLALLLAVMAVMAALQFGSVTAARMLSAPLLVLAIWASVIEERWFKLFPLLHQIFAVIVLVGFVAI
ncbi:MAG: hypothetical protein AAF899_08635 [Pseudomonadota bacterium]